MSVKYFSEMRHIGRGGDKKLTRHDHGTIILSLLDGVVAAPFPVVVAGLEHGEFEVEVGVEREDDG